MHTNSQRHRAIRVNSWANVHTRGYGFLVIETQEEIFFHCRKLPASIRGWFERNSTHPHLLPVVSFTINVDERGRREAHDIQLESEPNPELLWYRGNALISLYTGNDGELLPGSVSLARSEFIYCRIFSILPGCQDADEIRFVASIIPNRSFNFGNDTITVEVNSRVQTHIENNLLTELREKQSIPWLVERLINLKRSFNISLTSRIEKDLLAVINEEHIDDMSDEIAEQLSDFIPSIITSVWKRKATQIPMVALDLESDGNKIWQLAIIGQSETVVNLTNNPTDEQVQQEFTRATLGKNIVGHNIKAWDLPILDAKGCAVQDLHIYDTLEKEMLLCPLRPSYALDTAHNAVEDAQKTIELARNQYLRCQSPAVVRERAVEESHKFFLRYQSPAWRKVIEEILQNQTKTLIISSSEYAAALMLPPIVQVIQQTVRPINLNQQAEELCSRYEEEIRRLGYEPIYELAPAILRLQWEFGEGKSVPEIPSTVKSIYCSFADYARSEVRARIEQWGVETNYLVFPEIIPFDSRRCISKLTDREYTERIDNAGLWRHFGVGRSYVPLGDLRLQVEELLHEGDDKEGLTHFWLEKNIQGRVELWGCVTEQDLTRHLPNINLCPINKQRTNKWLIPITTSKAELLPDKRLNSETPYRSDYWEKLLPLITHYCQQKERTILAVSETEEISSLEKCLRELSFSGDIQLGTIIAYDGTGSHNLQQKIRQLAKSKNSLLLIPTQELERTIWELQAISGHILNCFCEYDKSNDRQYQVTILLESIPVHLTVPLGLLKNTLAPLLTTTAREDVSDNEQNPDGELESEEEDEAVKYQSEEQRLTRIPIADKVEAYLPLLEKTALWLTEDSAVRLVCLDPRLRAANYTEHNNIIKADELNEWPTISTDIQNNTEFYFHQPGEFSLPADEQEWIQAIQQAFIPGFELTEEQLNYLRGILPRKLDYCFVSLPTGGGKSIIFQAPALYRGHSTHRLTVVISPLKALIKDQERSLWNKGFITTVDGLTGDMTRDDIEDCYRRIRGGECLLVYTAPERFRSRSFRDTLEERFAKDGEPEFWVFDEAHSCSLWGLEFRPDYFYVAERVNQQRQQGKTTPILLLSATMTDMVKEDLLKILNVPRSI